MDKFKRIIQLLTTIAALITAIVGVLDVVQDLLLNPNEENNEE